MTGYVIVELEPVAISKVISQYIIWYYYKTLCKYTIQRGYVMYYKKKKKKYVIVIELEH